MSPMTTKVLLINPPWVSKDENIWNGIKAAMPPLSLLSIGAYLEQHGLHVSILDIHIEKLSAEQVKERIKAADPDWVGLQL